MCQENSPHFPQDLEPSKHICCMASGKWGAHEAVGLLLEDPPGTVREAEALQGQEDPEVWWEGWFHLCRKNM